MDKFINVSPGKQKLLEILDNLHPYEEVRIVADKDGKPDTFFVVRSSKVIVSGIYITSVK